MIDVWKSYGVDDQMSDDLAAITLIDHLQTLGVTSLGGAWLKRAEDQLIRKFDAAVTGKRQRITTEQAALAMLKGASLELEAAGKALDGAAEQLRESGMGRQASVTKQAATKAKAAAGELVP